MGPVRKSIVSALRAWEWFPTSERMAFRSRSSRRSSEVLLVGDSVGLN